MSRSAVRWTDGDRYTRRIAPLPAEPATALGRHLVVSFPRSCPPSSRTPSRSRSEITLFAQKGRSREVGPLLPDLRERALGGMYVRGMPTLIPPERLEPPNDPTNERAALEDRLEYQRTTLLLKCGGLAPEQLAEQSVPPSDLSLLGLVRHMSAVEAWFHSYDREPDHMFFWDYVPGATDGFGNINVDRAADDLASYQASVQRSRKAVRQRGLDEAMPGENYTLRWIYLHMIEEYARHNGHADLLRERIDGVTGE